MISRGKVVQMGPYMQNSGHPCLKVWAELAPSIFFPLSSFRHGWSTMRIAGGKSPFQS